jgi:hypothetical protein
VPPGRSTRADEVSNIISAFRTNIIDADIAVTSHFLAMEEKQDRPPAVSGDEVFRQSGFRYAVCVTTPDRHPSRRHRPL